MLYQIFDVCTLVRLSGKRTCIKLCMLRTGFACKHKCMRRTKAHRHVSKARQALRLQTAVIRMCVGQDSLRCDYALTRLDMQLPSYEIHANAWQKL